MQRKNILVLSLLFLVVLSGGVLFWYLTGKTQVKPSGEQQSPTNNTSSLEEEHRQIEELPKPEVQNELDMVVMRFNKATIDLDFESLYELSSSWITTGLTSAEFRQTVEAQIPKEGRVVQIENLSKPTIETNAAEMTFFTIDQRITSEKEEIKTSEDFTSVFIDEEGAWKFFSSEPLEK